MEIRTAIVRAPGPDANDGLTSQIGGAPDSAGLQRQHSAYCNALKSLGVRLIQLPPLPDFPDAYFVEDTAVVTPEVAVITRPGAPQRRGETPSIARVLKNFRPMESIQAPGTLDGGDVLTVDRRVFIGISSRTNQEGAGQLTRILTSCRYDCTRIAVHDNLHLKSNVTHLGEGRLLMNASWTDRSEFADYTKIPVSPSEIQACNALRINGRVLLSEGHPEVRTRLEALGLPIVTLKTSQIHRMDGGLTCLSIRF